MDSKLTRNVLLFLLAFLALGAIGGGAAMILSPSGELIHMPLSNLGSSPFTSFLVPGLILFVTLGVFPCLLIYALIKKQDSALAEKLNFFKGFHWSWTYTIYVAFILTGWIQIEMAFLQSVNWMHTFYMFYSIALIFTALLRQVRDLYKN
jgi:hypothetical protein